jgi:hypothetical protein
MPNGMRIACTTTVVLQLVEIFSATGEPPETEAHLDISLVTDCSSLTTSKSEMTIKTIPWLS